jgi:serine/threonine-protein kinase RsbW
MFVIADEGGGFDPEAVSSPLEEENLLKASGRGIFLMRTLMDRVEYTIDKKGVRLELWMNLSK